MIIIKKVIILLSALTVLACTQESPITIPKEKSDFYGVWIYKSNEYGNDVKIDNMLLAFHADSTVSYKRCIKRMNSHKNTSVPEAKLIKLTDKELVIKANLILMRMNLDFAIEKLPYLENNNWYMKVDGALLRKLKPGEKSDHHLWDCGDDTKQEEKDEGGTKF